MRDPRRVGGKLRHPTVDSPGRARALADRGDEIFGQGHDHHQRSHGQPDPPGRAHLEHAGREEQKPKARAQRAHHEANGIDGQAGGRMGQKGPGPVREHVGDPPGHRVVEGGPKHLLFAHRDRQRSQGQGGQAEIGGEP